MPDGPTILLTLKVLVSAVTLLFAASLVALLSGRTKLHGRINRVFFALTMLTVFGFEVLLRLGLDAAATFTPDARRMLFIHLCFAIPAAVMLPIMLFTGLKHKRSAHIGCGCVFLVLWLGTFITGVFWIPHQ